MIFAEVVTEQVGDKGLTPLSPRHFNRTRFQICNDVDSESKMLTLLKKYQIRNIDRQTKDFSYIILAMNNFRGGARI